MKKETLVMLIGLTVIFVPVLGIPNSWKQPFLYGAGIILVLIGYSLRRAAYLRSIETTTGERSTDSFMESAPIATTTKTDSLV